MNWALAAVFSLLALAAAALVAWPALRQRSGPAREGDEDASAAVYRDQLAEIARDVARGVIGPDEAEAARTEVSRRLLKAGAAGQDPERRWPADGRSRRVVLALAVAVPVSALAVYAFLGAPGLPGQPFAARRDAPPAKGPTVADLERLAALLEDRLKSAPGERRGWQILSTLYVRLGRMEDAGRAHARALALAGADAEVVARMSVEYGEALMARAGGQVTPAAKAAFSRALDARPKDPAARYYAGLAALQGGDPRGALSIWVPLRAEAPEGAPWAALLDRRIARIARETGLDPGQFR